VTSTALHPFPLSSLACLGTEVPDTPSPVRQTGTTTTTLSLTWDLPFSDGVWIDQHELQVVQLPDTYLPGGTFDGARCLGGSGPEGPCATAHVAAAVAATAARLFVLPPPPPQPPRRGGKDRAWTGAVAALTAGGGSGGSSGSGGGGGGGNGGGAAPTGTKRVGSGRWGALKDRQETVVRGNVGNTLGDAPVQTVELDCRPEGHDPNTAAFLSDCVQAPWVVRGGHNVHHTLRSLLPFTAYRVRLRLHSMVGWSDFSDSAVFFTAGMHRDSSGFRSWNSVLTCLLKWSW
jgi:hypothetical protein